MMEQLPFIMNEARVKKPARVANTQIRRKPVNAKNDTRYGKITEIITATTNLDDVPFLMPLLAQLSADDRWFAWIDPPKDLPKEMLIEAGIDLNKVILLHPSTKNSALDLAAKALRAGTYHAVISWQGAITENEISALEASATAGRSHGILVRTRHTH